MVPKLRLLTRIAIALGLSALLGLAILSRVPWTLSGKNSSVIGYELYADFNINRYLDGFYLLTVLFPVVAIVIYAILQRFGPLRSETPLRRTTRTEAPREAFTGEALPRSPLSDLLRTFVVGITLSLQYVVTQGYQTHNLWFGVLIGALAYVALVNVVLVIARRLVLIITSAHLNSIGALGSLVLLAETSQHTAVLVSQGGKIVHYGWFTTIAMVLSLVVVLALIVWKWRSKTPQEIERLLVTYLVVPIGLLVGLALLPGALGKFGAFTEGEYLAGGWLILHGAVPWKDTLEIHGVLDDGLKSMIGYEVFGFSRWGAAAGTTMFFIPAYWVSTYYFAASLFRKRPALLVASVIAILGGIFVDFDPRLVLWPISLLAFAALIRVPSRPRAWALGGIVVLQAALSPETLFVVPPFLVLLIVCDLTQRDRQRAVVLSLVRTGWFVCSSVLFSLCFLIFLVATGGLSGIVDYFKNFTDSHAATSGVPFYPSVRTISPLGIHIFHSKFPAIFSIALIQLWLPVLLIFGTIIAVVVANYRSRHLLVEHWVALAACGFILLWDQEVVSRGDGGHIALGFEATVPLILVLSSLTANAVERWLGLNRRKVRSSIPSERQHSFPGVRPGHLGAGICLLLVVVSPISFPNLVARQAASLHPVVGSASPPPVEPGGPSLGYNTNALGPKFTTAINDVLTRFAGKNGAVYDFSNAPGLFYFLYDRQPGTLFYDINMVDSPDAQQVVISNLKISQPRLVVWQGIGASEKEFIPNEIRDYLVARYVLSHYRPLLTIDREHFLIADNDSLAPSMATSRSLDLTGLECGWGDIPNFLISTIPEGKTRTVAVRELRQENGDTVYSVEVPQGFSSTYAGIAITRSNAESPGVVSLSDTLGPQGTELPGHEINWVDLQGTATTQVEAGSCLQWRGFTNKLLIVYKGGGIIRRVTLYQG